jgi:hypothetical protein
VVNIGYAFPVGSQYPVGMAEAASTESVPARLAAIREQLKLLADYL